jgi:hypothetical protein
MPALSGTVTNLVADPDPATDTSLWDFNHQTDWYVFGPAGGWTVTENRVYVPQQNHSIALHALHVVETVMFHRYKVLSP